MPSTTEQFLLGGREIDFDLIRKRTVLRNIHVRFEDDGRMKVSAPLRTSRRSIHLALTDMHDQIVELRREVRERNRGVPTHGFRQGSPHLYFGRTYTLDIWRHPQETPQVILRTDVMEVHVREWGEEAVREVLWAWYRRQAATHFAQRIDAITARSRGLRSAQYKLKLRRMRSSWGTCSVDGLITLNPLLMRAPFAYIDYVIAHELCHLREHNHSPAFYRLLERILPNWDTLRYALNERSHLYLRW